MNGWADDPELVATFRAEVDDRLASLCEGLLRLENAASPKQLVASLFRDAHTVKGSARMLGLDSVVEVAHLAEDLLGGLRDGRMPARKDLVDVLLVAAEGISRAMPGADRPVGPEDLASIVTALEAACAGQSPVTVPKLAGWTTRATLTACDRAAGTPSGCLRGACTTSSTSSVRQSWRSAG